MSDFDDLIGYDKIVEQSMRGVIGNVLKKIAKEGLPGDHHVFIVFKTDYKGVILSDRVKRQYPDSIKIILQNQFKITKITSKYFDIVLSFGGIEEKITIPFDSILEFTDPYIRFSLNFDTRFNISDDELEELIAEADEYYESLEDDSNGKKESKNNVISLASAKEKLYS